MSEPNYILKLVSWAKAQDYPLTLLAQFASVNYYTLHHHVAAKMNGNNRGPNKLTNIHAKKLYLSLKTATEDGDFKGLPRIARIAKINSALEAARAV